MIEIIPAIDIIGGECVRLTQGDYAQKTVYSKTPADVAASYEDAGLRRIHIVDLDGAKASRPENLAVLEAIANRTALDIQYGGGIKSADSLQAVFDAGAARAICGSVAVEVPAMFQSWLVEFGAGRVILGVDIRGGFVATHGWMNTSPLRADEIITRFDGLSQVICTDISKDGMLGGPSFELYTRLQGDFPAVDITVSGGISAMSDIERLNDMGLRSVIVGKALYENRITLAEISKFIANGR
jgi:phosphoribosylformimino-5-aminoimidazole carboxamide ribotide isomerase